MKTSVVVTWWAFLYGVLVITIATMIFADRQRVEQIDKKLDWAWLVVGLGFEFTNVHQHDWLFAIFWFLLTVMTARNIDKRRTKK